MKKTWKAWACVLGCILGLSACNDDDGVTTEPPFIQSASGVYILNQGSYGSIDGTLSYLNLTTSNMAGPDLFATANGGQSMGDTPQNLVVYGSHIYLAVYGSNVVWVLNRNTRAIQQMISTDQPRDLVAEGGKVYVSNYNGFVSRIDTTQLAVDATCRIGVYPEQMAVRDGYLYVANSYGLTADPSGSKVSKVKLDGFQLDSQIEVGLNPTKLTADGRGNLFVVVTGDYTGPSLVKKIDDEDRVTNLTQGTLVTTYGNMLYAVNTKYNTDYTVASNAVVSLNTETGDTISTNVIDIPTTYTPQSITVDPATGQFYVVGYPSANFLGAGVLLRYSYDGSLMSTQATGINPVAIVFDRD